MCELINIFKDVKSGALPLSEIRGFTLWAVSRRIWRLLLMVVLAAIIYSREKK